MSKTISIPAPDVDHRPYPWWTPARFVVAGGCTLIGLGLSGLLGISISRLDVFNAPSWINSLHLSVGTTALLVAAKGNAKILRAMAFVPAVLGSILGVGGLCLSLYAVHNSTPADLSEPLTHLCVGAMASWAAWNTRSRIG